MERFASLLARNQTGGAWRFMRNSIRSNGIPLDKIIVVQGDSDLIKQGAPADRVRSQAKQRQLATVDKVESFTLYFADKMVSQPRIFHLTMKHSARQFKPNADFP